MLGYLRQPSQQGNHLNQRDTRRTVNMNTPTSSGSFARYAAMKTAWIAAIFLVQGVAHGFEVNEDELLDPNNIVTLAQMKEAARIPTHLCPKALAPVNEDCASCSGYNPFNNPPLRKEDLGPNLEVIDEQAVSFTYNIQGRESSDGRVLNNHYPQSFKTQLLKNNKNGYFACMSFPPQEGPRHIFTYKESNLCVELPFKKGIVPQKGFMKSPDNFQLLTRNNYAFFDLKESCSEIGRTYHQRSQSGISAFGMVEPDKGSVYVLKYSFLDMQVFPSRQLIPFHNDSMPGKQGKFHKFSEYYCLSLVPKPNMVKDPGLLSGELHSCFRIGPMEYRK
jgi:hypothetical protein